MPVTYVDIDRAIALPGLRMVVVGGVPSPWSEAAKGIFHLKRIPWSAVRLAYDSDALRQWTGGQRSAPIAIHDDEPPRTGWEEILTLAERLAPAPRLLPDEPAARERVLQLGRDLLGAGGLAWTRRLQLIEAGLNGRGGFAPRVAGYLGKKYGHDAATGAAAGQRVIAQLGALADRMKAQRAAGSAYLVGDGVTAADVYAACTLALFAPLPDAVCAMDAATRAAFETLDAPTAAALDPILREHRAMMYARHLESPLSL